MRARVRREEYYLVDEDVISELDLQLLKESQSREVDLRVQSLMSQVRALF